MSVAKLSSMRRYVRGRKLRLDLRRSCCFGLLRRSRWRPVGGKRQRGWLDVEVFPAGLLLLEEALLGEDLQIDRCRLSFGDARRHQIANSAIWVREVHLGQLARYILGRSRRMRSAV
jgi:hypothetical protein